MALTGKEIVPLEAPKNLTPTAFLEMGQLSILTTDGTSKHLAVTAPCRSLHCFPSGSSLTDTNKL